MNIYDVDGHVLTTVSFFSPEQYGAIGDGVADDTAAFQSAVNQGGLVLCEAGKTYKTTDVIRVPKDIIIDLNGSSILATYKHLFYNFKSTDTSFTGYAGNGNICLRNGTIIGGAISFAHGENILLENMMFENSLNDHFLEIAGCKNYRIVNCSFIGMGNWDTSVLEYINLDHCRYNNFPWMPQGSTFYDNTVNDGVMVQDCRFSIGTGSYAYGYNAFGVHSVTSLPSNHTDITIKNCEIYGFTGCGLRLNGMTNIYVDDNRIQTTGNGIVIGDVGSCNTIVIKNNYVISTNGSKLVKTSGRYSNLTVVGNYTEGTIEDF